MGAQQGVAWGLSPGSEMLIMNINKVLRLYCTHTHTYSHFDYNIMPFLLNWNFLETSFFILLFSIWIHKEARHYYSPLVSIWSLWLDFYPPPLFCMKNPFQSAGIHPHPHIFCYLLPLLHVFLSRPLFFNPQNQRPPFFPESGAAEPRMKHYTVFLSWAILIGLQSTVIFSFLSCVLASGDAQMCVALQKLMTSKVPEC